MSTKTCIYSSFGRESWEKISENLFQINKISTALQSILWWICILTRRDNLTPTDLMEVCDSFSHHSYSSSLKVADKFWRESCLCLLRGLSAVILSKAPLPFPYIQNFPGLCRQFSISYTWEFPIMKILKHPYSKWTSALLLEICPISFWNQWT